MRDLSKAMAIHNAAVKAMKLMEKEKMSGNEICDVLEIVRIAITGESEDDNKECPECSELSEEEEDRLLNE